MTKRALTVLMAVLVILAAGAIGGTIGFRMANHQPTWVHNQIAWYEAQEYTRTHTAWQKSVAWGKGTYRGRPVEWFAYANTDAYIQFNLSVPITGDDIKKIGGITDRLKRPWEVKVHANFSPYGGPRTHTWIGASNDWALADSTEPYAAARGYIKQLNQALTPAIATFQIARYLQ